MPTKLKRLSLSLDDDTNARLSLFANYKQKRSSIAVEFIRYAMDIKEDMSLSKLSDEILDDDTETVSHDDAWK